jgi:hypothetical protein
VVKALCSNIVVPWYKHGAILPCCLTDIMDQSGAV